jgi:SAM-dependent methyltransferase
MREVGTADAAGAIGRAEAALAEAVFRRVLPAELLPYFGASFVRSHHLYDEFVYRLVLRVVRAAGLEAALREIGTPEEIGARAGLAPARALVPLGWMLKLLAVRGVVEEAAAGPVDRFRAPAPLPVLDPAPVREEQLRHDPSWRPAYVLAETVAADYPAFLRGEVAGEEILFSPRRLRLWVDYFSNDHGLYAVNNRVGAAAVARWLPREGGVILELGAGLGSGTLAVLERLAAVGRLGAIREYRFTEFVPAFLRRGQQAVEARYGGASRLSFGALDMNRPFGEQGVAPGSVAVVYAVNTLHVAHDLDFTLGEIRQALEPGGRLVASECVRPHPRRPLYAEFVFNLTETFRAPRLHPLYRPCGGFLTPEQWKAAIEAAGFVDIRFLPDLPRIRQDVPEFFVAAIGATKGVRS